MVIAVDSDLGGIGGGRSSWNCNILQWAVAEPHAGAKLSNSYETRFVPFAVCSAASFISINPLVHNGGLFIGVSSSSSHLVPRHIWYLPSVVRDGLSGCNEKMLESSFYQWSHNPVSEQERWAESFWDTFSVLRKKTSTLFLRLDIF